MASVLGRHPPLQGLPCFPALGEHLAQDGRTAPPRSGRSLQGRPSTRPASPEAPPSRLASLLTPLSRRTHKASLFTKRNFKSYQDRRFPGVRESQGFPRRSDRLRPSTAEEGLVSAQSLPKESGHRPSVRRRPRPRTARGAETPEPPRARGQSRCSVTALQGYSNTHCDCCFQDEFPARSVHHKSLVPILSGFALRCPVFLPVSNRIKYFRF